MPALPHRNHRPAARALSGGLLLLCAVLLLLCAAPRSLPASGLFGLVGVPSVDIEGYGWLGDLYLEHTLKVLSTSEEQPEPTIDAVFVEDALWILSGQLQQQGYLYPSIRARVSDEEGEVIYEGNWSGQELQPHLPTTLEGAHVLFTIDNGLLFYFDSITIQGLPADLTAMPESFFYPTDQLLSFKSTRFFNRSRGVGGVQAILARLRAMGYRDAKASDPIVNINRATGAVSFFAEISHGDIYYADERIIEPGSQALAAQVLGDIPLFLHLADTPRLTPEWLQNQLQQIRNRYYEHGYPEVRIFVHYEDVTDPLATLSPTADTEEDTTHAGAAVADVGTVTNAAVADAGGITTIDAATGGTSLASAQTLPGGHSAPPAGAAESTTGNALFAVDLAEQRAPTALPTTATENWADATPPPTVATTATASIRETAAAPVAVDAGAGFDPASATAALLAAEAEAQGQPTASQSAEKPAADTSTPNGGTNDTSPASAQSTAATAANATAASPAALNTAEVTDSTTPSTAVASPATEPPATAHAAIAPAAVRTRGHTPPSTRYQRVIIKVESGPQVKIGKVGFSGEYGTNQTVLQSQLTIAPGQKLDRNSVENTRNKLSSLGIFRSVEIDYTEVDTNTWDITYKMQMKQRTEVSLIAGVGTFDIIRGGFLIEQNNLFGLAHSQRLRAVQSFKATDISYRYGIPQIFGNDIDFYAKGSYLYRQEISFNRQEYGAAAGIQRYYRPLRTTFDLQYSLEQLSARNRDFLVAPGPTQATVSAISIKASHNGLDNPIFPTRGWQAHLSAEFAAKDLGGQVEYQRIDMAIAYHVPLTDTGLILHTGLRHGFITTTGTAVEEIPVNRRFFMGGENTVRGYRRDQAAPRNAQGNQIGAVSYVLWQVELEQRLTEDFSVVTFLDALGNAANISQYPFNETVASIGLGINYRTFVGPLRLEYGYNIKKRTGDPSGTIQVSIGFPF